MVHTQQSDVGYAGPASPHQDPATVSRWVGWVLFGGVVLLVVGAFNAIAGLVALFRAGYYHVESSDLTFGIDYVAWGWALLAFGALLLAAGIGVMFGQTWARVAAVILVSLNALANLGFVAANPVWALLMLALDVVVIYALVVHGREARALRS